MSRKAPQKLDLMEVAEWISDRTEVDVEIALEILEADYDFLKGDGLPGGEGGEGHRLLALAEQVAAVSARVPTGEDVVRTVLDAFMEYLQTRGYVREAPLLPQSPG
jgi:hypothetical protein